MEARQASLSAATARRFDHPGLGKVLAALDERLRQHYGVFEYTHSPDCLFRIAVVPSSYDVVLSDGVRVRRGDRLIALHLWNEQFPAFPQDGPTVAWARRIGRAFEKSLRELHDYLQSEPQLDDVAAICGNMPFGSSERRTQLGRLVGHFGFERVAVPAPLSTAELIRRFGENILISLMVWARNAAALHADTLWRDRATAFLSRQTLQRRYGSISGGAEASRRIGDQAVAAEHS